MKKLTPEEIAAYDYAFNIANGCSTAVFIAAKHGYATGYEAGRKAALEEFEKRLGTMAEKEIFQALQSGSK